MSTLTIKKPNFYRSLLLLALPIIAQEFINAGVNLADFMMIGSLGLDPMNGVGLGGQLTMICTLALFGVNSGASIFIGQFWGKGDKHNIHKVMGIAIVTNLSVTTLFALAAILLPEAILRLYSNEPEVVRLGALYLRTVGISYLFSGVSTSLNASLRSIGQTRIPMFTTLIALCTNVVLNYCAIFIFHWGVIGVGVSTIIARVVEVGVQVLIIKKLHLPVGAKLRRYFTADAVFVKKFFALAIPVILNETMWGLGTSLYNIAYKACGNEAQGAIQIGGNLQSVFNVLGFGVGSACGIMLANLLGAGEREEAISGARRGLILACAISAVMACVLLAISPFLISFYDVPQTVKDSARLTVFVVAGGLIFKTYNYTAIVGVLRSGGDTRFCLFADVAGVWAFGVPAAFLGAMLFKLPIHIVLLLVYSEELFKCIVVTWRIRRKKWAATLV